MTTEGLDDKRHRELKQSLKRIVSMLTRLIARSDVVAKPGTESNADIEYEYRDAEYEEGRKREPSCALKDGLRGFTNGKSIVHPR